VLPAVGSAAAASVPASTTSLPGGGLAQGYSDGGSTSPGSAGTGTGSASGSTAAPGQQFSGTFSGSGESINQGYVPESINYMGYVPTSYQAGSPVPLVVALHGCTQSADEFRQLTRWDQLAEAKGFVVVFPEQTTVNNLFKCWNWFQQAHTERGSGEPSLIAGVTQWVEQHYTIDPQRVAVNGLSAGAAMSSVMAATYPDLYAAAGVGSGCEYAATSACVGNKGTDPTQAGLLAYLAMGSHARPMPVVVFHGDQDNVVPPANGQQVVQQWQVTDRLAGGGWATPSFTGMAPAKVSSRRVPNGRSYTVRTYSDSQGADMTPWVSDGHGAAAIKYWVVHGMGHAWSGGCGCQPFADPAGPDETAAMYAFFMHHPMP
jgi:poly(hydroxyalkanoate) depolymerase family esterase